MANERLIEEILQCAESEYGQQLADKALARYKKAADGEKIIEIKEQDIMKVLKISYLAERFFGKSRSWLCHKINHDMVNGKRADLNDEERETLKNALETIAVEIQNLSDSM